MDLQVWFLLFLAYISDDDFHEPSLDELSLDQLKYGKAEILAIEDDDFLADDDEEEPSTQAEIIETVTLAAEEDNIASKKDEDGISFENAFNALFFTQHSDSFPAFVSHNQIHNLIPCRLWPNWKSV